MSGDRHIVDETGALPLPWLEGPLDDALSRHQGHALLVHGASGVGAMAFAFTLAQGWLCEAEGVVDGAAGREADSASPLTQQSPRKRSRPCGRCGSCRLVQAHLHPDLTVLIPETLRRAHGWPLPDDKAESDRKPSRQIRIDEVRLLIDRATRTSARGRGKVGVLHPAEALNLQSANALLKTLEEPPPGTRLLLTTADPALLLPTVRSRCQQLRLSAPTSDVATAWLCDHGVPSAADAATLLAAVGGRPLEALDWIRAGVDATAWSALPRALAAGDASALAGWPVPRAIDALQKVCHDALAVAVGGGPRYFPATSMPSAFSAARLSAWSLELARTARHADHPWNEGLLTESAVQAARAALGAPVASQPVSRPGQSRSGVGGFDTLIP